MRSVGRQRQVVVAALDAPTLQTWRSLRVPVLNFTEFGDSTDFRGIGSDQARFRRMGAMKVAAFNKLLKLGRSVQCPPCRRASPALTCSRLPSPPTAPITSTLSLPPYTLPLHRSRSLCGDPFTSTALSPPHASLSPSDGFLSRMWTPFGSKTRLHF